jgi:hypothetical protein
VCFSRQRAHGWVIRLAFGRYVAVFLASFAGEHILDLLVAANRRVLHAYTSIAKYDLVCCFRVSAKDPKVSVLFPAL